MYKSTANLDKIVRHCRQVNRTCANAIYPIAILNNLEVTPLIFEDDGYGGWAPVGITENIISSIRSYKECKHPVGFDGELMFFNDLRIGAQNKLFDYEFTVYLVENGSVERDILVESVHGINISNCD